MRRLLLLSTCGLFPLLGCDARYSARNYPAEAAAKTAVPFPAASAPVSPEVTTLRNTAIDKNRMDGSMAGMMGMATDGAVATSVAVQPPAEGAAPANASGISRKVVYDAVLELTVDSVEPASKRVPELVEDARGYISEQSMTGSPGAQRAEHWKIRIPVEKFDSFVEAVKPMGELAQFTRTSQDVTAEFYDVEARIKNKKIEEQTLNKILQERSGKLDDVLKIEVELSRVRGEIEQMQGRIRVLENLSSLATLTLNIRERDKFAPAAPVVADFRTQIGRTWQESVLSLTDLGKGLVLFAVSWAVWTPFLAVLAILAWIVLRRLAPTLRRLSQSVITVPPRPSVRPPGGE